MTIRTWVDIEDAAGAKLGGGPVVSVMDWQQTARLDRAGDFAFRMPATDARAAEVRPKRYARCWHAGPEGVKSLGYGRIERVELRESPTGPVLEVSGSDLLGELSDRIMRRTSLKVEVTAHPAGVAVAGLSSTTQIYDYQPGDTTTYVTVPAGYGAGGIVISSPYKFHKITIGIGDTPQSNAGTPRYQYSTPTAWKDFAAGKITDTTYVGPDPLAQSGTITFDPPPDWEPWDTFFKYQVYIQEIDPAGWGAGGFDVTDISITYFLPTVTALDDIMDYAPAGWSLDAANGYSTLQYRPLSGTELVLNGGFETFTGTADDGTSDTWTSWDVGAGGGSAVLAVTTHAEGSYGLKLLQGATLYAFAAQDVAATGSTEYTLRFKSLGDGTSGATWRVFDDDGGPATLDTAITSLTFSTNVSATEWQDEYHTFVTPETCTSIKIVFYSPIQVNGFCVVDDVSLQAGGGNSIYLQCSDESVLEMLIRVAEATGEHFILSPDGRKVLWLGNDERTLALRAVSNVNPVEVAGVDDIAIITEISEAEDSADVVTRVYPYGAGMGASRVTLASATTEPPAGYVMSTTSNYVERTAAVTEFGVVETARSWSDIVEQSDDTTSAAQSAANILLIQAVNWLSTHSATSTDRLTGDVPRFYTLGLAKCERLLLPGYKLRVVHHRWVDGYHAVAIDRDLWINAATWRVGQNGAETVKLDVATVDRQPVNDAIAIATGIRRIVGLSAHNTAAGY
jgi:hypothetical protein